MKRMKGILTNNLWLKILSIFLAFFVWLVVVNVSNPWISGKKEVTLEIENDRVLESAGKTYEINGKSTVTVTYEVHTKDDYKISPSNFRASVDLAELYDVTSSVRVNVEMVANSDLVRNVEARPGVVQVVTENLQVKPFELVPDTTGVKMAGSDYALNGVALSPESITVKGPVSEVGVISYAGVEIRADGLEGDAEGTVEPVFYDANGNKLTLSDRIEVDTGEIGYRLTVNKVKSLPLDFEVTGTVAPGYRYTGVVCDTKNVSVTGLKSSLATINKITVPASELNLGGTTQDKLVTVDLRNYLPEGVEIVGSEKPVVEILLRVEKLVNRTVTLDEADMGRTGGSEDYRYRLVPDQIEVTVQGLEEDLEKIGAADLKAELSLTGLQPGSHNGILKFALSDVFHVVSYTDFKVEVTELGAGPGETTVAGPTAAGNATESSQYGTPEESGDNGSDGATVSGSGSLAKETAGEKGSADTPSEPTGSP